MPRCFNRLLPLHSSLYYVFSWPGKLVVLPLLFCAVHAADFLLQSSIASLRPLRAYTPWLDVIEKAAA